MKKITLHIEDENLQIVMTILENLKSGLITKIESDGVKELKSTQYQPKNNGVIYEHESGTNDVSGKYSAQAYKARLKK